MSANLFAPGDVVRHRKGGEYVVIGRCTFEPTMADCYAYRGEGGRMWVRPVEAMEDGRFKLVARDAVKSSPPESDVRLCSVCGDPVRYGSRHYQCGSAVMALEAEIERLRGLLNTRSVVKLLFRRLDEIERLRADLDQQTLRATAEAEAAARLRAELDALQQAFALEKRAHELTWDRKAKLIDELAAKNALLLEALEEIHIYSPGAVSLYERIRAALGGG